MSSVSKVVFGNTTVMDITDSTVTASKLKSGETAYAANGAKITGELVVPEVLDDLSDVTINTPANAHEIYYDGSQWINYGAKILLTFDDAFQGQTITLSKDQTVITKVTPSTGNSMSLYVSETGEWTISSTIDEETYETVVTITAFGLTYTAELESTPPIPEGATVEPTDDIQIWLACANLNKPYTTLAEVLADRETFETLIADSNACDYMVRSTTWAVNTVSVVPIMTDNTHPSGVASASSVYDNSDVYQAWKAFNGTNTDVYDCWASVKNATYPQYLDYEFEEPVCINRVEYYTRNYNESSSPKDVDLQAYDGSAWITLGSNTSTVATLNTKVGFSVNNYQKYSKYRFNIRSKNGSSPTYICIGELGYFEPAITTSQDAMALIGKYDYCSNALLGNATWAEAIVSSDYWDSICNVSVPKMTSNTAPSGEAFASSTYSSSYPAYYAFDKNDTTFWSSQSSGNQYVGYKFTSAVNIKALFIYPNLNAGTTYELKLQGSNDNSTWTDIKTFEIDGLTQTYISVTNNNSYFYYRVLREGGWQAFTIQFYGRSTNEVLVPLVPTMTSDTTPSGICSANSVYDSRYPAWKAFNGNSDDDDCWASAISANSHIQYEFVKPTIANRMSLINRYASSTKTQGVNTFDILASNDGFVNDINTLYSGTAQQTSSKTTQIFDFDNSTAYKYYRLLAKTNHGYSGATAVVELQFYQKTVQTNIIHSCANDTIYTYDEGSTVVLATTNSDGDGVLDFSTLEDKVYTLYSTVAKNPNDLTLPFAKRIRITKSQYGGTTERYLLPDTIRTLYWYGYEDDNLEDATSANGWSGTQSSNYQAPTHNTTDILCTSSGNYVFQGVANKNQISNMTKAHGIFKSTRGAIGDSNQKGYLIATPSKSYDPYTSRYVYSTTSEERGDINTGSSPYLYIGSAWGNQGNAYGLWYELSIKAIPTFISAVNDSLYIMDGNTKIWIANTDGEGKSLAPMLEPGTYTIYSSVAKDPNNLSNPYSKTVTVDESTQTIKVMPENTLYWYGYEDNELQDITSANGWTLNNTPVAPTHNTNNISIPGNGGIGTKNLKTVTNANIIASRTGSDGGSTFAFDTNKDLRSGVHDNVAVPSSLSKTQITNTGSDSYIATWTGSNRTITLYAFWYE